MNLKKISFIILLFFISFLTIIAFTSIGNNNNNFAQALKSLIPEKIKIYLKKTIFVIPLLVEENKIFKKKIYNLEIKNSVLESQIYKINNPIYLKKLETKLIFSNDDEEYLLEQYKLPFPDHDGWALKPVAYIEKYKDKIIVASGKADFFYFDSSGIGKENLLYNEIQTNINDIIQDKKFYEPFILSIKDLFINDDKIYLSYGSQKNNCISISILVADINFNKLMFKNFFKKSECHQFFKDNEMNYQHIGGRIVNYKNNQLLLSIGDFGNENMVQNKNSILGKIISIDETKKINIISLGTRNPQGLKYDVKKDVIINTEHGPTGGDEINVNKQTNILKNFGWPIASYGVSSDGKKYESHIKNNFIEPIKYFDPSIGISELIKIENNFNEKFTNDYFVTSLGWKSQIADGDNTIHHIRFDEEYSKIIYYDKIIINERIRDAIYLDSEKNVLLSLESIPALGFLSKKN